MEFFKFPDDFLWGTATSAHQIEGNNTNSDWWEWENRYPRKKSKLPLVDKAKWPLEPSLEACDSYMRYEEDLHHAAKLNNNAIRIGIEWARLEPKRGTFNKEEFEHYKKVIQTAKDHGLRTFVTLHHFTNPIWFAEKGGWTNPFSARWFSNYAKKCAEEFGSLIDVYLTINEPQVYSMISYLLGRWPPQKTNPAKVITVQINMMRAHNKAYKEIKKIGNYKTGIVKNIAWNMPSPKSWNPLDKVVANLLNFLNTDFFLKPIRKNLDLLGVNYYFTNYIKNFFIKNPNDRVSDLGWWLETNGIRNILLNLKKYEIPLYITENGLADAKDSHRTWYFQEILKSCALAISEGAPLKGYFHWSLIDNFEWAEGFWPRFGLIDIDKENNNQREPRKSYYEYAKICKSGTIKM